MRNFVRIFTILTALSLPMTACGIKPNSVDAPQGKDQDEFPRTYPADK